MNRLKQVLIKGRTFQFGSCLLSLLNACGNSNSSKDEPASATSALVGSWKTGCEDSSYYSSVDTWTFSTSTFNVYKRYYSDLACESDLFETRINNNLYETPSADTVKFSGDGDPTLMVLVRAEDIALANSQKFCEIADWTSGQERDVSTKSCSWTFSDSKSLGIGTKESEPSPATTQTYSINGETLTIGEGDSSVVFARVQ